MFTLIYCARLMLTLPPPLEAMACRYADITSLRRYYFRYATWRFRHAAIRHFDSIRDYALRARARFTRDYAAFSIRQPRYVAITPFRLRLLCRAICQLSPLFRFSLAYAAAAAAAWFAAAGCYAIDYAGCATPDTRI